MTLTDLIIAALAVWEIIEIWKHGSIFASWRDYIDNYWRGPVSGWFAELLSCGFCLAPWVALCVVEGMYYDELFRVENTRMIVYFLAVARLANLGNDMTHFLCRTPRIGKEVAADPDLKSAFEDSKGGIKETKDGAGPA